MFYQRRIWFFVVFTVVSVSLVTQQALNSIPSSAQNIHLTTLLKTFDNPSIGGQRLDFCYTWEHNCGAPVAKAFCQLNGYSKLVNSGIDISPKTTKVIGDGRVCQEKINHPNCDSFKFITCSNQFAKNFPGYNDIPLSGNLDDLKKKDDLGPIPENIGESNTLPNGTIEIASPKNDSSGNIPIKEIKYKVGTNINPAIPIPKMDIDLKLSDEFKNKNIFELNLKVDSLNYKYNFSPNNLVNIYPTLLRGYL